MAEFPVNSQRFDPYKQYKFRVKWDNRFIPSISYVSSLRRITEVVAHREGGDPNTVRRAPGLTTFPPLILSRGRTQDPAFEQWAELVWSHSRGLGNEIFLKEFRKDIHIELMNEAGELVMRFKVYRCWPSEYQPLSDLDSDTNTVALETLTLQYEAWERDITVAEPVEP
jgi:phage tail-like protein